MIETSSTEAGGGSRSLALRDLSTGTLFPVTQDLGPGSLACHLDPGGLAAACAAVERGIRDGADFVVLSKFGKQEAAHSGLYEAFLGAMNSGLPIVTAVSPALAAPWEAFAGGLSLYLPATIEALEAWMIRFESGGLRAAAE